MSSLPVLGLFINLPNAILAQSPSGSTVRNSRAKLGLFVAAYLDHTIIHSDLVIGENTASYLTS